MIEKNITTQGIFIDRQFQSLVIGFASTNRRLTNRLLVSLYAKTKDDLDETMLGDPTVLGDAERFSGLR